MDYSSKNNSLCPPFAQMTIPCHVTCTSVELWDFFLKLCIGFFPSPHTLRKWAIPFLSSIRDQQVPGRWEECWDWRIENPKEPFFFSSASVHSTWFKEKALMDYYCPQVPSQTLRASWLPKEERNSQVFLFWCNYDWQFKISQELYWQCHLEHNGLMVLSV